MFDEMSAHAYTEEQLVERPAIGLFAEPYCASSIVRAEALTP